jgi:hypothetical protein
LPSSRGGVTVKAPIISSEGKLPMADVVIVCPARKPRSKCELRTKAECEDDHCLYYRGDSLSGYAIIGPGMDKKSYRGWE